ncbi:MAG: DUF4296 domain-containing protein [Syntrophothermus sp.]
MRVFLVSFLLLLIALSQVSCRQKPSHIYAGIPQDSVISEEVMVKMLSDVHLIEGALQMERSKGLDPVKLSPQYYKAFFSKYKVSEKRFLSSLEYYKQDQASFIKMYNQVIDTLTQRSQKIKEPAGAEPE